MLAELVGWSKEAFEGRGCRVGAPGLLVVFLAGGREEEVEKEERWVGCVCNLG